MNYKDLKFRGISKQNNKWVYGSLTVEYDGTCHLNWWESVLIEPENNYYEPKHFFEQIIPETLGMKVMTVKASLETEYYTGDLVLVKGRKGIGTYKDEIMFEGNKFTLATNNTYFTSDSCLIAILSKLGTIHDNLLK